ncbi:hypothetical protein PsorP6_006044 [Peronosclerospora sorghi]|uniref:Uncharacterized protein n=1 Tax=Peronosclerospora sorghi TaxID=230839 RepID=A0ACC0W5W1_9STRA|nr:hypothetical protein PsorP6_006044 [Peronosclerospora sorghi]
MSGVSLLRSYLIQLASPNCSYSFSSDFKFASDRDVMLLIDKSLQQKHQVERVNWSGGNRCRLLNLHGLDVRDTLNLLNASAAHCERILDYAYIILITMGINENRLAIIAPSHEYDTPLCATTRCLRCRRPMQQQSQYDLTNGVH